MTDLTRDAFDFSLPPELIAQTPARPREAARLLHVVGSSLSDHAIRDLPDLLRPGDLLVGNDTRVIPARLYGRRGRAQVELLLHRRLGAAHWQAFARPAKRLRVDDRIVFAENFSAEVTAKGANGLVEARFDGTDTDLERNLARHGLMPLPPYIRRGHEGCAADREDYQTVFAARDGAVAAPTAGLHFTPELLARLEAKGVERAAVTLHVGAGTFLPVKAERLADHVMHPEWGAITPEVAAQINRTRAAGGRIVAIGTTVLRLMESACGADGLISPFQGETRIFLHPGKAIRSADLLLTNFHLPQSTLFMLACGFAGMEPVQAAYRHAIAQRYRFYSYGDACLLERA